MAAVRAPPPLLPQTVLDWTTVFTLRAVPHPNPAGHGIKMVFDSAGATMALLLILLQHVPANFFRQAVHTVVAQNRCGTKQPQVQELHPCKPGPGAFPGRGGAPRSGPYGPPQNNCAKSPQSAPQHQPRWNATGAVPAAPPPPPPPPPRGHHGVPVGYNIDTHMVPKSSLSSLIAMSNLLLLPEAACNHNSHWIFNSSTTTLGDGGDDGANDSKRSTRRRRGAQHDPHKAAGSGTEDDDFPDRAPDQGSPNADAPRESS